MSDQTDLADRVAALEKHSGGGVPSGHASRRLAEIGSLIVILLLTLNAWLTWKNLALLATSKTEHHFWVLCHRGASDEQRRNAFTALVSVGHREWRSARLSRLDLHRGDFVGAQLEQADLDGCDLNQSVLTGANLKRANLRISRLAGADLSQADLTEASLLKADLSGATLRSANLRTANLEQADLKNADLAASDLTEANLLLATLTGVSLRNANLSSCNLDGADLRGADLAGATLDNASLRDTQFKDSNWWRAAGFPSGTLERLRHDAAPSDRASPARRKDYATWLAQ